MGFFDQGKGTGSNGRGFFTGVVPVNLGWKVLGCQKGVGRYWDVIFQKSLSKDLAGAYP